MTPTASAPPPLVADEVTMLRGFLGFFRDTLRRQTEGLTGEQFAARLEPSTMTLGGMLKHLAYVEQWWFSVMLHGREPSGIWADIDWKADQDWDWHSAAQDTPEELRDMFDEAVAVADRELDLALAQGGMDAIAARPRRGEAVSLRWIVVHMVEEYARHCGHADLIRESIDGATDL